ncbi:expressed unknown protein [Seminavis robusta]|uniref:Uncharacterized protein n=1 Tax=Seminavis robusta TaxID=568900 RepID=A0A9N8DD71_9STRA|nr:expressed unknown protein [Seminavis robusta]|eukprot:Sro88_g046520.1 n/a (205) ;mRNA; r:67423-68037
MQGYRTRKKRAASNQAQETDAGWTDRTEAQLKAAGGAANEVMDILVELSIVFQLDECPRQLVKRLLYPRGGDKSAFSCAIEHLKHEGSIKVCGQDLKLSRKACKSKCTRPATNDEMHYRVLVILTKQVHPESLPSLVKLWTLLCNGSQHKVQDLRNPSEKASDDTSYDKGFSRAMAALDSLGLIEKVGDTIGLADIAFPEGRPS